MLPDESNLCLEQSVELLITIDVRSYGAFVLIDREARGQFGDNFRSEVLLKKFKLFCTKISFWNDKFY